MKFDTQAHKIEKTYQKKYFIKISEHMSAQDVNVYPILSVIAHCFSMYANNASKIFNFS